MITLNISSYTITILGSIASYFIYFIFIGRENVTRMDKAVMVLFTLVPILNISVAILAAIYGYFLFLDEKELESN